ncbi:hypothetical protein EV363DRAFT_644049 [Boletus edulis]|nr:hypothetical protein EV363DRAFT_644049 [Boletus edulis]
MGIICEKHARLVTRLLSCFAFFPTSACCPLEYTVPDTPKELAWLKTTELHVRGQKGRVWRIKGRRTRLLASRK